MTSESPPQGRVSRRSIASLAVALLFFAGLFQFVLDRSSPQTTEAILLRVGLLLFILAGIGLAHSARRAIRRNPQGLRGEGLARLGLVLGYVGIVLLFLAVLFAPL